VSLRERDAPDSARLETANQLIESLELELRSKEVEVEGYVAMVEAAEARAETSEHEYRALLYRFRQLEARAASPTIGAHQELPLLPTNWADFLDWVDQTYPDRVLFTPSARRMVRAPAFQNVATVAHAIRWLATEHYDRRCAGGGSMSGALIAPGLQNALCGGDEYATYWHGRTQKVDWHVKNGGNTRDPTRCLRVYYFWDPDTQQVVIDWLPSHRTTTAT
jgi:hypothetical protein